MEGFSFVDIYATKGIEYLIVIGFLATFVFFWRSMAPRTGESVMERVAPEVVEWFRVPRELHFHRGHSWAKEGRDGNAVVGLDDFAQKFVGRVESVDLPPVGSRLAQGEKGWSLRVGSRDIPMLSPIDGEVVAINEEAVRSPGIVNEDPFGMGWLLKIRPERFSANRTGLLSGRLAMRWTEEILHDLRLAMGGSLGPLYQDGGTTLPVHQDGGTPVAGIARALYGEDWEPKVREHFLTDAID